MLVFQQLFERIDIVNVPHILRVHIVKVFLHRSFAFALRLVGLRLDDTCDDGAPERHAWQRVVLSVVRVFLWVAQRQVDGITGWQAEIRAIPKRSHMSAG